MSAKPLQNLFIKLVKIAFIFLYLQLLLWSTLLHPAIKIDEHWVPKSFFFSTKQSTCIIPMHYTTRAVFESTFFATIALFGYFGDSAGIEGVGRTIYNSTLASAEQSMMGVLKKYYWLCILPWIITFTQNWFQNVGEFLLLFSHHTTVYEALNAFPFMTIFMLLLFVQALLASEVIYMALQGWRAMKNINDML